MNHWLKTGLPLACVAALTFSLLALGDDDDDKPAAPDAAGSQALLSAPQQQAVGIVVARPAAASAPEQVAALGLVLDPTALLSDLGDSNSAAAAAHSAALEVSRLHALFEGGAGASQKMLETAQAEQSKAQAEAELTAARLSLHWGPLLSQAAGVRQKTIDAAISGRELLLRADLPGRHSLGATPAKALVDVDGIEVPAQILGALRQSNESQSVGLLLEIRNPPSGLGPGARVPVRLMSATKSGMLLPREAILYDENGAYVYKRSAKAVDGKLSYVPVKVTLLLPYGDGWLVSGVDDDDDIVVRGAGVLWSLQGVGNHAVDDDDD
jgi:multidrug efflux pump subunit AcrA (membrane-fusion protein)